MHSRIRVFVILLIALHNLTETHFAHAAPIIVHRSVSIDSSGCCTVSVDSSKLLTVLDCNLDTLRLNADYQISNGRICLVFDSFSCDSLWISERTTHDFQSSPISLREYVTASQMAEISDPMQMPTPIQETRGSNLKISGNKSFYADVSDRDNTTLGQGLSLTVTGDIGHDVLVSGSFSDRGTRDNRLVTRRFSELENVYLEVTSPSLSGIFGSFRLTQNQSQFLSFERNVQGLKASYTRDRGRSEISLSVPQGNYSENEFAAGDGNYGPYRLRGSNGELGIAVVENSEAVWLNGERLARGVDQDYYLDYLQGELFFTSRQAIDASDRVRVEFEFQKLEYRKTLLTASNSISSSDSTRTLTFGYAGFMTSESDPLDFTLSESELSRLREIGDNSDSAVVSGVRFVGPGLGSYIVEVDSVGDTVYRFVGSGEGDYTVTFSEFETGDYSYRGGGEYRYAGRGRGRFLPLKRLPLPESTNFVVAASSVKPIPEITLGGELLFSNHDRNEFSSFGDSDNNSVAGVLTVGVQPASKTLSGVIRAELLPDDFPRISRTDDVEASYLWQRDGSSASGRKRLLAEIEIRPVNQWQTNIVGGFSDEQSSLKSRRVTIDNQLNRFAAGSVGVQLNLASSRQDSISRSLIQVKPIWRSQLLPIKLELSGDFDRRSSRVRAIQALDSKREIESTLSYEGVSIGGRLRENWRKADSNWNRVDQKQSLLFGVSRNLDPSNKFDIGLTLNRFRQASQRENYQTGNLSITLPTLLPMLNLSSNYRLNRKGFSQTNQSYLKVDPGEGDYVLFDSVYIAQSRGDYILVSENVGKVSQNAEASKHVLADLDIEKLTESFLTKGTSFRYEINMREVGPYESSLSAAWLLPPKEFFDSATKIRQHSADYKLRRFEKKVGLRVELAYNRRNEENRLEIQEPLVRRQKEVRLSFNKNFVNRDYAAISLINRESSTSESSYLRLFFHEQRVELSTSHFSSLWELTLAASISRETSDSLALLARAIRISPGVNYSLSGGARVELATFLYRVTEFSDRPIFVQMAEGFPVGTHAGGRLRVDLGLSESFSFKVSGQAEFRQHDENRYFLRTELISRFK